MPYGVRVSTNGRSAVDPLGTKIVVWSLTPSRMGIIASLESKLGRGTGGPCVFARAGRGPPIRAAANDARRRAEDRLTVHMAHLLWSGQGLCSRESALGRTQNLFVPGHGRRFSAPRQLVLRLAGA